MAGKREDGKQKGGGGIGGDGEGNGKFSEACSRKK